MSKAQEVRASKWFICLCSWAKLREDRVDGNWHERSCKFMNSVQNKFDFLDIISRKCFPIRSTVNITFSHIQMMITHFPEDKRNFSPVRKAHQVVMYCRSRDKAEVVVPRDTKSPAEWRKTNSVELANFFRLDLSFSFEESNPWFSNSSKGSRINYPRLVSKTATFCLYRFNPSPAT